MLPAIGGQMDQMSSAVNASRDIPETRIQDEQGRASPPLAAGTFARQVLVRAQDKQYLGLP
jgi:hypothetical protein